MLADLQTAYIQAVERAGASTVEDEEGFGWIDVALHGLE